MAEEEGSANEAVALKHTFQDLISQLKRSSESTLDASNSFCQDFCQILMHHGCQWKPDEDLLPLLEMYTVAIMCCAEASPFLSPECEHVSDVVNKLSWSCLNLLLSFSEQIPGALWEEFQTSVKMAHGVLQAHGNSQLHTLLTLSEENSVWSNTTLCSILSNDVSNVERVREFLSREGPELLHMRIKHLIKQKHMEKAARLAKTCAEFPEFGGKKNFKQIYLVCLCEIKPQQELMHEIKEVDCKEALDMICNLESEEDEKGALGLCTAFFKRQLLSGDAYCAWELTLFWSKLLIRLESKYAFLEQCRLLSRLSGSVYHILLLIKVIQAEVDKDGLSVCIEMCVQALKMGVHDNEGCDITICKTISCLLPLDLEVKQACQLTEFLIKPSLESYYAVETLFNEPDQKLDPEDPPILNSLRCDLLLALKTKWPFDPEFWDWKTLKRQCLALMGQEATAILSADRFADSDDNEVHDHDEKYFQHFADDPSLEPGEVNGQRKKKKDSKKMKERGFVSARFRNWQAYMQYCVLCDKEFLGHRIVKHALKHVQDGIFRCPICAKTFESRAVLEPHVASHVKQSCDERLAAMGVSKKRPTCETKLTPSGSTLKKEKEERTICSNASIGNTSTDVKSKIKSSSPKQANPVRDVNNTKECSCPVTSCQKVFKYFRNLVAHVRAHKNEQEATYFLQIQSQKALCQYCHRQFVNLTHLNDHLQMHCGEKPYFCVQLGCICSFSSHAELLMHREVHAEFQAQCAFPNCERIFSETYLLYDHEAQHYLTFPCKSHNCDKVFNTLPELVLHQKGHAKQAIDGRSSHVHIEGPAQIRPALELPPTCQDFTPVELNRPAEDIVDRTQGSTEQPEHLLPSTAELQEKKTHSETIATQPNESGKSPTKSLESCYVKLEPIPIKSNDQAYLNALKISDSGAQALLKDKKLFSLTQIQLKPSTLESCPATPEPSPTTSKTCPTTPESSPATSKTCPATPEPSPATSKTCPTTSETCPATPEPSPATSKTCPTTSETCPATPEPSPATSKTCPTTSKTCPATPEPSPATSKTCPATSKPSPATSKTCPTTPEPSPATSKTCRATSKTCPATPEPSPATSKSFPATSKPSPAISKTCPATPESSPATSKTCPAIPEPSPATSKTCPATSKTCPATPEPSPATSKTCPATSKTCPATPEPSPATSKTCPATPKSSPATSKSSPATSKSSLTVMKDNREERLTYVCPFETCTRKYSTSKSLSRHVKNVHAEAFEEWKLSKKYKRIAQIAAKKSKRTTTSIPTPVTNWASYPQPTEQAALLESVIQSPFSDHVSMQSIGPNFCSQLEIAQSAATTNHTGLMHLPVTQAWASPSVENLSSGFSEHDSYHSMILSDNQHTNPSYHSDSILDYASVSSYDDLSMSAHTPSGVMNEASKYVSSSLRVLHALNGDLSQVESGINPAFNPNLDDGLHAGTLSGQNVSLYFPSEASPVENSNKDIDSECSDALFASEIKSMSNLLSPRFKESAEDFFGATPPTDEKSLEDYCNHELSQEDDQSLSDSGETKKSKKCKSSKRTKWPAIIQDGKVICCRCYREFSSTKSLGGHLSKRSQCKPVEEIDLTADLPVSFLDFLNDPDISMVQMPLPANDGVEHNHNKSSIYAPSESIRFNENTLLDINTNMSSQDPTELSGNPFFSNAGAEIRPGAEIVSVAEDGKIVEIERALQRLDLVGEKSVSESTILHDLSSEALPRNDQHHTIPDPVQTEQKCVLKPFKCREDCAYGAMTKEALFKHLSRVHDYSEDRINEIKKNPDRFAPYSCHLCSKTFTRTTGLKIHYKNVHHYSKEEMSRLKIGLGFRKTKKSLSSADSVHADTPSEQFQHHHIDPNLTITSVNSNANRKANIVRPKKTKRPTKSSLTVEEPQKSVKNLDRVKQESPSIKIESHVTELNDLALFGGIPLLLNQKQPEYATPQSYRQIETTSSVFVESDERTKTAVDNAESAEAQSVYRPYRCVHEGCVAAFSIHQNLILHYRAMHQSECDEKSSPKATDGAVQAQEYKCQVKQCSKVVSKVTSLLKHYLLLHRCTLEKASALLSGVEVGTFQCDQSKCSAHFTCHLKYIDHIKNDHKAIKVSVDGDFESVNLTFGCQFKGCDRVYTTKSNLLRHLMKKHDATFETMTKDAQVKKKPDSNNGKENIANSKNKIKKKSWKRKEDKPQNWGLKSTDEASAMCSQMFPLQYPCMIKSCDSVMSAEQSILAHYTTHGLTERDIEDQRSQFIFCVKSDQAPGPETTSHTAEVEEPVLETLHSAEVEEPVLDASPNVEVEEPVLNTSHHVENENSKVSSQEPPMTEAAIPPAGKRKRGRPPKSDSRNTISVERKQSLRKCPGEQVKCMLKVSGSILSSSNSGGNHVENKVALKLYKPSEFETSVLALGDDSLSSASKRPRTRKNTLGKKGRVVDFRNPLKMETVQNVKIVMYDNQSPCPGLVLKQLQDMQPMVILEKKLHS